ncbi:MAG TPA: RsmD family RNA methyltransferase, partial [Bacilli bacterium]|nr:RsmD family RNA methyltransferase [Bacilli bacterium]
MRIIAGKFKGRKLNTLEGLNTRPMLDRMKESVFNILGPYFDGQKVLDLFGGSGALSLEALSRGCLHA